MKKKLGLIVGSAMMALSAQGAMAACSDITPVLSGAVAAATTANTDAGYPLYFWITAVDESGKVCAVTTNGTPGALSGNSQWLGSRVISAQKANTANAFSLDNYAISTANLYTPVQPGGSLYGLQHSNPVDASRAYGGNPNTYGTNADYLKNKRIGGVNVFGGGLALYKNGRKVGAIGVSGDTSCADHAFAWAVRDALNMEPLDGQDSALSGASESGAVGITTVNFEADGTFISGADGIGVQGDEMVLGGEGTYWEGWAHPACPNTTYAGPGYIVVPAAP